MSRVLIRLYLCYLACVFFVISVYFYYHAYDLEKGFGMKKIKSTIATLICSMALILGVATAANAADYSVTSMTEVCKITHGNGWWYAEHKYAGAYGWRCTYTQPPWEQKVYKNADVQKYCNVMYGNANAIATNPSNPNSWVCRK